MPYPKETIAEVIAAFDKSYEEHKHEWPTKICGPNLVGILNTAGFYQKKEWVGLTDAEKQEAYIKIDTWDACVSFIEAKLKEKNT
jgi:hypothetical protein